MAKPHINLVFIGHVDHGKSTLIGRTMYETNRISDRDLEQLEKYSEKGKAFKFAWIMDKEKEERDRGLTIDIAYSDFESRKNYFTIIDAPGHRNFVKNMITGTSQGDAAVLLVAADDGVMPQTREHTYLAKTAGIDQLIVVINKMDLVNYSQARYQTVKTDTSHLLESIGYDVSQTTFIPVSAFYGDNVTQPSDKMSWHEEMTFLECLDTLKPPEKPIDKPLRIPIQNVYSIKGVGTVPIGRVETGVLKVGDEIVIEPADVSGEVKSIEMHHQTLDKAEPGDNIGFNVRGIEKHEIQRGDVAGNPQNPPRVANKIKARIVIVEYPTTIAPGFTPVLHCHAAHVPTTITQLFQKIDSRTGEVIEENPPYLQKGDAAVVELMPQKPLSLEKASEIPPMGRFALRHANMTVAVGMCLELQ